MFSFPMTEYVKRFICRWEKKSPVLGGGVRFFKEGFGEAFFWIEERERESGGCLMGEEEMLDC